MKKRTLKKVQAGVLSLAAIGFLAGCGTDDTMDMDPVIEDTTMEDTTMEESMEDTTAMEEDTSMEEGMEAEEDVVGLAQGNEDFSILVSALQEAELVETLQGEGPFTVFAPTNEAFEKLMDELDITSEELLAQPDLDKILTYHVVSGKVLAGDLEDGMNAETLNGEEVMFDLSGDPMVNDAMISMTDMEATNGVVHAIDTVLVPADFELQK